ncbi:putative flavin-containing monooxygenase FMO GS-OX-like 10, partial [Bienertia sinuspersici]
NHFQRWLSNLRKFASLEVGRPGLVAARELRREGHEVVLGGVWAYSPKVESDPLGLDRTRYIIHFVLIFLEREQIHSHNNRTPEPYQDQGHCWTGKEVHIIARSEEVGRFRKYPIYDNTWLHPMVKNSPMRRANNNDVKRAHGDGRVSFKDGSEVLADLILHCTWYKYHFPFLHTGGTVNVDDNRVGMLYNHVFPLTLVLGLSFVGVLSAIDQHYKFHVKFSLFSLLNLKVSVFYQGGFHFHLKKR